jgi:hypothetical protein
MANARCMRAAQVQAREVGFTPASSGPAASGAAAAEWWLERLSDFVV